MKIEDHSTGEIALENLKRAKTCIKCGVGGYALKDSSHKNHISLVYTDTYREGLKRDCAKLEYVCKNCQKDMYQQLQIDGTKETIKSNSCRINKIKKPNCDKCQINAMHNPTHSTCGDCGAKAYDDCVCDLYYIENNKIHLDDLLSGRAGPKGYQRSGGIICISYSYEVIFTCPVHGEQEARAGKHSRNKFYKWL